MGMYDDIRFKYPLPPGTPNLGWQTKDTPAQFLDLYEVRAAGDASLAREWCLDSEGRRRAVLAGELFGNSEGMAIGS